jgi:hypothetical protein
VIYILGCDVSFAVQYIYYKIDIFISRNNKIDHCLLFSPIDVKTVSEGPEGSSEIQNERSEIQYPNQPIRVGKPSLVKHCCKDWGITMLLGDGCVVGIQRFMNL